MKRLSTMMLVILLATLVAACGNESATPAPASSPWSGSRRWAEPGWWW